MNSIGEIEAALQQLSVEDQGRIARRLLKRLQELKRQELAGKELGGNGSQAQLLPDYAARRRRIFGDQVLPNQVLANRAEERW